MPGMEPTKYKSLDTYTNPGRENLGRLEALRELPPGLRPENETSLNLIPVRDPDNYADSPVKGGVRYLFRAHERAKTFHEIPSIPKLPPEATAQLPATGVAGLNKGTPSTSDTGLQPPIAKAAIVAAEGGGGGVSVPKYNNRGGGGADHANGRGGMPHDRQYAAAAIERGYMIGRVLPHGRHRHVQPECLAAQATWMQQLASTAKIETDYELVALPLQVREERLRLRLAEVERAKQEAGDRLAELISGVTGGRSAAEAAELEGYCQQLAAQTAGVERRLHLARVERAERATQATQQIVARRERAESTYSGRIRASQSLCAQAPNVASQQPEAAPGQRGRRQQVAATSNTSVSD